MENSSQGSHVLIVDDDPAICKLLAIKLTSAGFVCKSCEGGDEALLLLLQERFDAVISDLNMPGVTGFEVLESLTSLAPQLQALPFIFLTARIDRDSELQGRRLGADDYVTKPIDFERLATIIEARLGQGARHDVWARRIALNEREVDCLTWSARGKTSVEIATILGVGKRTVDFHIDNACRKLNVATRTEAVVKATSSHLIDPKDGRGR